MPPSPLELPLSYWGSLAQFWCASPWAACPLGPLHPTTAPASPTGHALLTFSPDLMDSMNTEARGSSRRAQTQWEWIHISAKKQVGEASSQDASSQTSLLTLQENEYNSFMQIEDCMQMWVSTLCLLPQQVQPPRFVTSARDLPSCPSGLVALCGWKL